MSKWFSMKGRTALVTGASMSIGRSIALGFADHGARVAIHYSAAADAAAGLAQAAQSTADEVRARGAEASWSMPICCRKAAAGALSTAPPRN